MVVSNQARVFKFELDIMNHRIKNSGWYLQPIPGKGRVFVEPFQDSFVCGLRGSNRIAVFKDSIWIAQYHVDPLLGMKILPDGSIIGLCTDGVVVYDSKIFFQPKNWKRMNLHLAVFDVGFCWK